MNALPAESQHRMYISLAEFCTMFMHNTYPFKKPEVEKTKISENYKMVRQPTNLNADTTTVPTAANTTTATT